MREKTKQENVDRTSCKFNQGVICGLKNKCDGCGWNPRVASDRKLKRKCDIWRKETGK